MHHSSLRHFAESSDAFIALDLSARVLHLNSPAAALLRQVYGVELSAELRETLRSVLPTAAEPLLHACERALVERQPVRCEVPASSGSSWLELQAFPAEHGLSLFLRDITLLKQAEQDFRLLSGEPSLPPTELTATKSASDPFQVVVENLLESLGIYSAVRDASGRIVDFRIEYVNDEACRNNQLTREEQVGRLLGDVLPGHHESGLMAEYARVVETGEPLQKDALIYEDVYGQQQLTRAFDIRAARLGDGFVATWRDITGRPVAQETVEHSEARLQSILEQLPSALLIAEAPSGRITVMNPEAERIVGSTRNPVRQTDDYQQFEIYHPDGRPYRLEEHPALRGLRGELIRGEFLLFRGSDGLLRELRVNVAPLRNHREEITGCVCVFDDLAEQRRAQSALDESERRFAALAASAPVGIFRTDPNGEFLWVNPQWSVQTGLSLEAALGSGWVEALEPTERAGVLSRWQAAVRDGREFQSEFRYRTPSGATSWVQGRAVPLRDAADTVTGYVGTVSDITALQESEERRSAALAASETGTFRWDLRTNALEWDENLDRLFGLQPGVTARSLGAFIQLVHPDDRAEVIARCERCATEGADFEMEFRTFWPDGSLRWLYDKGKTILDLEGRPAYMTGACVDITDRKLAEAALAEREEQLRLALEAAELGAWDLNLQTGELRWSERCRAMLGFSPDVEATMSRFWERLHPEDRQPTDAAIQRSLSPQGDGEFDIDYRIIRDDGSIRWISAAGKTLYEGEEASRRAVRFIGAVLDVTERRAAELALRESEERLRTVAESIPQMVWVTRPDGWHEHYNQRWYDYTGLSPEESLGWGWIRPLHAEDRARSEARWHEATSSGQPYEIEYRLRGADGQYRWFLGRALPLRDSRGEISRWFGTCTDIHDQKQAQEERALLLKREQWRSHQLRRLAQAGLDVNAAPTLAEILDVVTGQARETIGARLAVTSTSTGEEWSQARHTIQAGEGYAAWADPTLRLTSAGVSPDCYQQSRVALLTETELRAREGLTGFAVESGTELPTRGWIVAPLLARDGRRLGLLQLSAKEDGEFSGDDALLLLQLAQMAAVAIEKARLHEEIRRADQVKTEFLAMLAHELRNPLSPILTATQVLRARPTVDTSERAISVIERQAGHLSRLVDDLLDVSRISRGKIELRLEPVALTRIAEQAVEAARPSAEARGHRLEVTTHPGLWLQADSARLVQVLTNLLNNAVKYTDPGGEIHLSTSLEEGRVVIRVRDTGIGIAAEDLPYIFDLFAQVDRDLSRSQGGLGIGLTMVRNLVQLHGGTVAATSPGRGKGSLFTIALPLIPNPAEDAHQGGDPVTTSRRQQRKVVVVDDNRDAAETLADLLQIWGHEPHLAHDGEEGMALVLREQPEIAFLDIGLPGLDGYEIARRLRREPSLQGLVLVALTGYGQEEDRRKALEAGFDHHHTKPISPDLIRKLLEPLQ